jgi:aminoglycoside 3-N-acetyltransferase
MLKDIGKVYTKNDIIRQLENMNIPRGRIVLMHSSLRLVGRTEEGAKTVLDAMIEYFTAEGGLFCVPTHTWGNLKKDITLDMSSSQTCLGAFSDFCAADSRGIRSLNPTHSMAVFGDRDRALEFIKDELYLPSGTAPESCYGKIYRAGGIILLVGVAHNKNTYLHCVEEMLDMPNRLSAEKRTVKIKLADGEIITKEIRTHKADFTKDVSARFPKYETAFRYHGAITDGFVGNAPTQACDAVIMKEVMELILSRADGTDPLFEERGMPPAWYC